MVYNPNLDEMREVKEKKAENAVLLRAQKFSQNEKKVSIACYIITVEHRRLFYTNTMYLRHRISILFQPTQISFSRLSGAPISRMR